MGLYDDIEVDDARLVCSEGHRPRDFQTKDLGCTMGTWTLRKGKLTGSAGDSGHAPTQPVSGRIALYTSCEHCPAFIAPKTHNVLEAWVEFAAEFVGGELRFLVRISPSTPEWIASIPKNENLRGAEGPLPHSEAMALGRQRRNLR